MSGFIITFKNNKKITFADVITLNSTQRQKIISFASNEYQEELKVRKSGYKISLTEKQKQTLLKTKNRLTHDKSEMELYNSNIIIFEGHAVERIIKRIGQPTITLYGTLINKIKNTNNVLSKGEWKGYSRLSYTYIDNSDSEGYKFTITFILNQDRIKLVTISNFNLESMDYRITENQTSNEQLLELKNKLKKRLKEDN